MPAEHLRQSPLRELYLRAGAMTAAPTGWSFDCGSWQASSHWAKLGIPIWLKASVQLLTLPPRKAWYPDLAQSISATLNFAAALNAYTLTDRAAWANFRNRQNLEILTEGDPILFNQYGSILMNPAKWPQVKFREAKTWHEWLTSKVGLAAITSYRINGDELFFPPRSEATN